MSGRFVRISAGLMLAALACLFFVFVILKYKVFGQ